MFQLKLGPLQFTHAKTYNGDGTGLAGTGSTFYSPSFDGMFKGWLRKFGAFKSVLRGQFGETNLHEIFYSIPEVFAPVKTIADAVIKGKIELVKIDGEEVVTNNEQINHFLSQPNPLRTFMELFWEGVVNEIISGNAYQYAPMSDMLTFRLENISTVWNLPTHMTHERIPSRIKLFTADKMEDILPGYTFSYNASEPKNIPAQQMFHLKNPNICWDYNPFRGKSALWAAEYPISNLVAVYEARNVIYVKRGMLGMLVSRRTDQSGMIALAAGAKKQVLEDVQKSYGITGDRSPIGVSDQPLDFIRMLMSIQELEPFKETEMSAKAIYGILQVPEDLMPGAQGVTYENQRIAERRLYQNVAITIGERFVNGWSNWFKLSDKGLKLRISYNHIEALQENKKEKSEVDNRNNLTWLSQFTCGIITLNQWLAYAGLEQVTIPLYNKRTFEMLPAELAMVKEILTLAKPTASINIGQQQNPGDNGNGATQ